MRNVVVGTKSKNDTNDPVKLGTLVSHDFLITFSLNATEVSKISLGQELVATIPFTKSEPLKATITEISTLPENPSIAQYEVRALINNESLPKDLVLREGITTQIVLSKEQKENVVRIPKTAINYDGDRAFVKKIIEPNEELKEQIEFDGAVDLSQSVTQTIEVDVEIGIEGRNYIEIISGVSVGDYVVSTTLFEKNEFDLGGIPGDFDESDFDDSEGGEVIEF